MARTLIKSILAGISISIGALVYLNVGGVPGACLFAIGILMVTFGHFKLYTGAIGYISSYKEIPNMLIIILGNFIGTCLMFCFPNPIAQTMIIAKLSTPLVLVFIKAIICGLLIYCSVEAYKENKLFITFLCIPTFILLGAEHSIANFCYFISARYFDWYLIPYSLIVIIGNAIGSIIFNKVKRLK